MRVFFTDVVSRQVAMTPPESHAEYLVKSQVCS